MSESFQLSRVVDATVEGLLQSRNRSLKGALQRGNDSTTWNVTAGAWNKLRDGWFSLMFDLGIVDAVERMCPGKVMRLMAADVAWWHRASGGDLHPDTAVWMALPRPWEVLSGEAVCPVSLVEDVCARHGLDPVKSGWSHGAVQQTTVHSKRRGPLALRRWDRNGASTRSTVGVLVVQRGDPIAFCSGSRISTDGRQKVMPRALPLTRKSPLRC